MSTKKVFAFKNESGETMPRYGIGQLSSVTTRMPGGEPVYSLNKVTDVFGALVVNLGASVPDDGYSSGVSIEDAETVLVDEDGPQSTEVGFGDEIGPVVGQWYADSTGSGQRVMDASFEGRVPVVWIPGSGTGGSAGGGGGCGCSCIENGDITVSGLETTSSWQVLLGPVTIEVANGSVTLPYGNYVLVWDNAESHWSVDIGDFLTAADTGGDPVTEGVTLAGELIFVKSEGGRMKLKLEVTATIPAP